MAYTYLALARLGAGSTGLTLKTAIVNVAGTIHASVRDIACPERHVLGAYLFRTDTMPDDYEGTVVFYTGTLGAASDFAGVTVYHEELISPREAEYADIKTSDVSAAIAALSIPTVSQIWTTALTEAYAADGAAFTGAQAVYMIWSALSEFAISGTTITAKRLDGTTTSMVFTLNSSTAPTSRERAS